MTLPEMRKWLFRGALVLAALVVLISQLAVPSRPKDDDIPGVVLSAEERRRFNYERREREEAERALFCAGRPSDVHC